jgi:hypothetical protein
MESAYAIQDPVIAEPADKWTKGQLAVFVLLVYLVPLVAIIACARALFSKEMDRKSALYGFTSILVWITFAAMIM